MKKRVLVLVGTRKGAFILEGDARRKSWELRGPFCEHWPMNHVVGDAETGAIYGGGGNEWFGPAVWKSTDLGESWTHSSDGLAYETGEEPIKAVWSVAPRERQPLCRRAAGRAVPQRRSAARPGQHVEGLQKHPSRPQWNPGGAGLILHSLVPASARTRTSIWIGISAAGVFHTADGGETWEPRNRGTRADFLPEGQNYPEFGQCVHNLVMAPGMPDRLYQQNHCGMYRSDDGGKSWQSIENGLPSSFGFPAAAHPRDPDTAFLIPLNGDSGGPLRAGRQGRGLAHARRRQELAGSARRAAAGERLFRRAEAGDGDRPAGAGRRLFRHQHRHALRQRRRGRQLDADRRASADDLLGRDAGRRELTAMAGETRVERTTGAAVTVRLPGVLVDLFPGSLRRSKCRRQPSTR